MGAPTLFLPIFPEQIPNPGSPLIWIRQCNWLLLPNYNMWLLPSYNRLLLPSYLRPVYAPCPLFLVVGVVLLLDVHLDDVILPVLSTSGDLLPQVPLHLREKRSYSIELLLKWNLLGKHYYLQKACFVNYTLQEQRSLLTNP